MSNPNTPRRVSNAFLTNLDQPMPWPRKLALLTRNISLRVIKRQTCCGHDGEPGC